MRARPNRWQSRSISLAIICAIALAAGGCGEKKEIVGVNTQQDPFTLLLDWQPNADHAGIYTAIDKGNFTDQGIRLKVQVPSDPAAVIQQVSAGRVDIGISYEQELLAARDKGIKVKAVAAIVYQPLNSLMWLNSSGIKRISDLEGKHVGISGSFPEPYLDTILKSNGVNPKKVKRTNIGYDLVTSLVSKKVDAVLGAYPNVEAVQLRLKKRPVTAITVNKAGVPTYDELVFIVNEDALKDQTKFDKIRRFLAAVSNGTTSAIAEPKAAQSALANADKSVDQKFLSASLKATLPLLAPPAKSTFGQMDQTQWQTFADWMHDNALLKNKADASKALTTDLLPGA